MQQNHSNLNARASGPAPMPFAGANGSSLAEMAQRDLDAALQLLADRAQYITGATGAAIALRCDGRNDMLCRATTGPNAPELGTLLSTEFGLSGESVRSRRVLRCDDAERDARVNREVCRQLGIASVVVMPVVDDDEVLGVFELFSGKVNAFGERDLSAVQRLSEMVETAVRLAQATVNLPEPLAVNSGAASMGQKIESQESEEILDEEIFAAPAFAQKTSGALDSEKVLSAPPPVQTEKAPAEAAAGTVASGPISPVPPPGELPSAPKPLFWSAHVNPAEPTNTEPELNHIPPVLRGLRKCEVCGFPITAGRVLCVECEEKKWRGQLRKSSPADRTAAGPPVKTPTISELKSAGHGTSSSAHLPEKRSPAVPAAEPAVRPANPPATIPQKTDLQPKLAAVPPAPAQQTPTAPEQPKAQAGAPALVLSAGIEPSQSWLAANKYIIIVLLAVAAVAAFVLVR